MAIRYTRTDNSRLTSWWWTIDRWTLAAVIMLILVGAIMVMAASPAVAVRIDLSPFYFVKRQFMYLAAASLVIVGVSFLSPKGVRRLAVLTTGGAILMMMVTLIIGEEVKGATRWITFAGLSLQPSEFVKPGFAVLAAWMFSEQSKHEKFPGYFISITSFVLISALLLLQPDVGMTLVVAAVWGIQFFIAGLPLFWVLGIVGVFMSGIVGAYFMFGHVQSRVDRFLDPDQSEGYQVSRALEAFQNGGWIGRGPGEGKVKEVLPDAHADFIFAVTGEEFGLIASMILVGLFLFVVLRGFNRTFKSGDLFQLLAVSGLLSQFAIQALINMASTLNLMPPKGMTLPFISYGGSSTMALALGMGMVLALTRDGADDRRWS